MPPVAAALAPLGASLGAALGLTGATATGMMAATVVIENALNAAFLQIATGAALSVAGQMLAGEPKGLAGSAGVSATVKFGEETPATFCLGRRATAGDLLHACNHDRDDDDDPNEYYVYCVELSDFPQPLRRVRVNGEWVTLDATPHANRGRPVPKYRHKGKDHLWIHFFDGTQTADDPRLTQIRYLFEESGMPWEADMVGYGVTWACIVAKYNPKVHRGVPEVLFELDGIRLYDPRRDSTAGGSGSQRWADQSTWSPAGDPANDNPIVQAYNVMRGIRDPITDEYLLGTADITEADLPPAIWFAAMNACDADAVASQGGVQRAYRTGMEVRLTDDVDRADILEAILRGCAGRMGECGDVWQVHVGPPGAAVYAFTDDDLILTSPDDFDPFPGLEDVFNAATATYPSPADGWAAKDAPRRASAAYRAADGGRLQTAALTFGNVWERDQVQRLMRLALEDQRRFRRHVLVLPPEARALGLTDPVAWTSPRNGYEDKIFTIEMMEPTPAGCWLVTLKEWDPTDYDFGAVDYLPTDPGFTFRPPTPTVPPDFSVEAATVPDADGVGRRPDIRLHWNPNVVARGVRWQYRVVGQAAPSQMAGGVETSDDDLEASVLEVWPGEAVQAFAGQPIEAGYFSLVALGTTLILKGSGLPATPYQVRARYDRDGADGPWSAWMAVTTTDTRIIAADLHSDLVEDIEQARLDAEQAREDALAAVEAAQDALDQVAVLAGDTIEDLQALLAELQGVSAGGLVEARLLALSGLPSSWLADPTWQQWTGSAPDHWTVTGGTVAPHAGVYAGGGASLETTGATSLTLRAASDVAGQMPRANAATEWVVLGFLVSVETAAALTGVRIHVAWRAAGAPSWTRGTMRGVAAAEGLLGSQHGLVHAPGQRQGVEVLVRRPSGLGAADAVSVAIEKLGTVTGAVTLRLSSAWIRAASEAEVAAGQAAGNLSAAVTSLTTTITGVSNALAATQTSLTAQINSVSAELHQDYLTTVGVNSALATLQTALSAQIGGVSANLATNYYTRVQVDGAVTTAIAAFAQSLSVNTVEGLNVRLTDEAALRISGDTILGGRIETLEARNPGSVVPNGSFAAMRAPVAPATVSAGPVGWTLPGAVLRRARGSGGFAALVACPAAAALHFPFSATTLTAIADAMDAAEGDVVTFGMSYATGGTTRSANLKMRVRFLDAAGATLYSTSRGPDAASLTGWTRTLGAELWVTDPAPAGTASVRVELWRAGGGAGDAFVTQVEAVVRDKAAAAAITEVSVVATRADSAIASLSTSISAEFGSQSAFISSMATAYANAEEAISGVKTRIKAGSAVGTVEMVAFQGQPGLPAGTVYRLAFDNIDLDGKVSARHLAVFDGTNMVPDDQLQDALAWGITASTAEWELDPASAVGDGRSLGEIRWRRVAGTTGLAYLHGPKFKVQPGDKLLAKYRTRVGPGTPSAHRTWAALAWYDKAGDYIGNASIDADATALTAASTRERGPSVLIVPAGVEMARVRLAVDRDLTTAAMVRFLAPEVRRQTPAVLIEDGAITAEKIRVTSLGAISATLGDVVITSSLNLGPGVVVTGALVPNAVSDVGGGVRESRLTLTNDDQWYDVASYTVAVPSGASLVLGTTIDWERELYWTGVAVSGGLQFSSAPAIHEARLVRGTATVVHTGTRESIVAALPAGTHTLRLQARTREPDNWVVGGTTFRPSSRGESARIGYGHVLAQVFKR